jgi:hypothetical protein
VNEKLTDSIDYIQSNGDLNAIDSLSEIVAEYTAADNNLAQGITNALGTHNSALAAEAARAFAAEAALQADVDQNEADADAALAAEVARAKEAEYYLGVQAAGIDSKVTDEIASRDVMVHSLSADGTTMTLSGMATMNNLVVNASVKVGSISDPAAAGYEDAAALAAGAFDGMMFYYSGADGASAVFPDGAKWYFCEGQTWFASVFHTEDT